MTGAAFTDEPVEVVPADDVHVGDEVILKHVGSQVVSQIRVHDDEITIVYFKRGELTYENKARARRGMHLNSRKLIELSLTPKAPDEEVRIRRGSVFQADELRAEMEAQEKERFASRFDDAKAAA